MVLCVAKVQPPPSTEHHCSVPFEGPHTDMCTVESSEIRTPPYKQDSLLWSQWCPYYRGSTVQDCVLWSQWCPYCRGSTVQDCVLWSQWCPYCRGSTVQDCVLWSQWCPYCRGSTVQDCVLWSQWCPYCRGYAVIHPQPHLPGTAHHTMWAVVRLWLTNSSLNYSVPVFL